MTVPTLKQLIEEENVRHLEVRVIIGGAELPKWTSINYQFSMGQVPTATIVIPGKQYLPNAVVEEAYVQIWFGFRSGMALLEQLVFAGAVVDSVGNNGNDVIVDCVMDGPRKLTYSYNRRIDYEFEAVTAEEAVTDLMALAGVTNYYLELDPWVIGTAVPQTIEFSTYGEAINKIAEVDGSPWYAMPTGQVRVENRDPVPSPSARRTYFSNLITGIESTIPTSIANTDALPRINDVQRRKFRDEVGNFIEVDGAVVITIGPNGEQNSNQIFETVDGSSGQFPNGAYWIPIPPLFQDFTFSNELIDTNAKAFEVAERYFALKNRLHEKLSISVPGDPDVFLGSTVRITDPNYSGISSLYFVEGYRTSITETDCVTELQLTGGEEAGTTGFAAPFAEFFWKYQQIHHVIPGRWENIKWMDVSWGSDIGSELCIDVPSGTGKVPQGGNVVPGSDSRKVLIGLDGSASADFDGQIVSWDWEYIDADLNVQQLSGKRILLAFNPDDVTSVEVTLTVTDDSGRTSTITKTIYTNADYLVPEFPAYPDPTLNDTPQGGGVAIGPCTPPVPVDPDETPPIPGTGGNKPGNCSGLEYGILVAAGDYAMGSVDNRTWNDLTKGGAGVVGDFISVAGGQIIATQRAYGFFGTNQGELVITQDLCVTGANVFEVPGTPRIETIVIDGLEMGVPAQGSETGNEGGSDDSEIPVYTQVSPGTLTIRQAYEQCLAVGFSPTSAAIAVAILIAESGLLSNATNSVGNTPPSTDRGIAQINSYWHPEVSDTCAFNTECAIREMYRISSGGSDYSPWSGYNAGVYRQHLSVVQEQLGIDGSVGDEDRGYTKSIPRSFKVWFGTGDGKIYLSTDSGRTWILWRNFETGWPVNVLITDRRLAYPLTEVPSLCAFGGDTSDPESLIQVAANNEGGFEPIRIGGALKAHIDSIGAGFSIKGAALNETALLVVLSDDTVWISQNAIEDPDSWVSANGLSGAYGFSDINEVAPGFDGQFLLAGDVGVWRSIDNDTFALVGSTAQSVNQIFWTGIHDVYLAAAEDGILESMDSGEGWGYLRPNPQFGTAWPVGAEAHQISFSVGARECPETWACGTVFLAQGDAFLVTPPFIGVYDQDGNQLDQLIWPDGEPGNNFRGIALHPITGDLYGIVDDTFFTDQIVVVVFSATPPHDIVRVMDISNEVGGIPYHIAFLPNGEFLVTYDGGIARWSDQGELLQFHSSSFAFDIDVSSDGLYFFNLAGSTVYTFDPTTEVITQWAEDETLFITSFRLLPGTNGGMVTSNNGIWQRDGSGAPGASYTGLDQTTLKLALDNENSCFWARSDDQFAKIDMLSGQYIKGPFSIDGIGFSQTQGMCVQCAPPGGNGGPGGYVGPVPPEPPTPSPEWSEPFFYYVANSGVSIQIFTGEAYVLAVYNGALDVNADADLYDLGINEFSKLYSKGCPVASGPIDERDDVTYTYQAYLIVGVGPSPEFTFTGGGSAVGVRISTGIDVNNPLVASDFTNASIRVEAPDPTECGFYWGGSETDMSVNVAGVDPNDLVIVWSYGSHPWPNGGCHDVTSPEGILRQADSAPYVHNAWWTYQIGSGIPDVPEYVGWANVQTVDCYIAAPWLGNPNCGQGDSGTYPREGIGVALNAVRLRKTS